MLAGINVARLGIIAYEVISDVTFVKILLSIVTFVVFGTIFYKMTIKHNDKIVSHESETRPIWHFFDLKSYLIMAVMMSGGIWLRFSGLVQDVFIAVFYTGLGCALTLAGVLFWIMFFRYEED